ncbi:hypothetical protein F5884DRAFT_821500 [Xylogone sp. PMI_703]|nr:hypothetical protein F5884DRAFT_821500 [Xylogone sp. PMI_703]
MALVQDNCDMTLKSVALHSSQHQSSSKNAWLAFLKSIATFNGDLSSLTAPPFLLSPMSIIEFSTYWAEHPSLFVAPASETDPEKRALLVLKWFLSTLRQQHNNKDENGKKKKMKPLNPFLGELFMGKWEDEAGVTQLLAEQVSHHPPATATNIWNEEHGVRLQGTVAPKVYFSGTVQIDRKGYNVLHLDKYNEDYLITLPHVHVEGLITGALAPELSGTSYIRSSSGYHSKIDYNGKGWLSGKKNSRTPLTVAPIELQDPMESRRAWQRVSEGIHRGDMFTVGREKSKIENQQRELRKIEKSEGREYQRKFFKRVEHDEVVDKILKGAKDEKSVRADMECGHGLWVFDETKYKEFPLKARRDSKMSQAS